MKILLREQIETFRRRTGEPLTYARLAERTGLSRATIESMATRPRYNATLEVVERLCAALGCAPGDLLALERRSEEAA